MKPHKYLRMSQQQRASAGKMISFAVALTAELPTGRWHVCAWICPFTVSGATLSRLQMEKVEMWFPGPEQNVFPASDSLPFDATIRFFPWNTISGRRDGEHIHL